MSVYLLYSVVWFSYLYLYCELSFPDAFIYDLMNDASTCSWLDGSQNMLFQQMILCSVYSERDFLRNK
jgi:hypothetical protein